MKVFLDTSVFLWAFNEPSSNSASIVELANDRKIEVIISEKVLEELKQFFTNFHDERTWFEMHAFTTTLCKVISKEEIEPEIKNWRGKIKEKDLEHLATVKCLKLNMLVAFDRDFENFPEYITPKQFLKKLGEKTSKTEY